MKTTNDTRGNRKPPESPYLFVFFVSFVVPPVSNATHLINLRKSVKSADELTSSWIGPRLRIGAFWTHENNKAGDTLRTRGGDKPPPLKVRIFRVVRVFRGSPPRQGDEEAKATSDLVDSPPAYRSENRNVARSPLARSTVRVTVSPGRFFWSV